MNRSIILAASLIAAMTTGTLADTIDDRQANHAERIRQARQSGQLTAHEVAKLRAEQGRIRELERHVKADGIVTHREARLMDRVQDAANRHIVKESRDSERAWYRRWY